MVNVFFYINGKFLVIECENSKALKYGDFLNYPKSHMEVWDEKYYNKYKVDFDYFPRGRVVYNMKEKCYYIYSDKCIKDLNNILEKYKNEKYKLCTDLHYKCHKCNKNYIM